MVSKNKKNAERRREYYICISDSFRIDIHFKNTIITPLTYSQKEDLNENTIIYPQSVIVLSQGSWSTDNRVYIRASVTVQDSTNKIISLSNLSLGGWANGVDTASVSIGQATVWNAGSYATATITYKYNGTLTTTLCYFYP